MKAHAPRDRTAQHRTCADSGLDARVLRCRWRHRARDTSICNSKAPCAAPSTSSLNALHRVPIPWRRSPARTRKPSQRIAGSHSRVPSSVTTQAHQCDPFQQAAQRLSPGLRPDAPDCNRAAGRRASPIVGRFGGFFTMSQELKGKADDVNADPRLLPSSAPGSRSAGQGQSFSASSPCHGCDEIATTDDAHHLATTRQRSLIDLPSQKQGRDVLDRRGPVNGNRRGRHDVLGVVIYGLHGCDAVLFQQARPRRHRR